MKKVDEGYYPTGKKSSYSDNIPEVKIILQHSRALEEGERRYRAVEKIFVENASGERFAIPTNKPGLARVYARHIAEGGTPYDEAGKHITSLCEEYSKMAGFVRATRSKQFNESTQSLVNEGINHYQKLRETLGKMQGHRGYHAYFESFAPALMEDEDTTDLSEMFASSELDPRIESVMPILRKLNKSLGEMVETTDLGKWADDIIEESFEEVDEVSAAAAGRAAEREFADNGSALQKAPAAAPTASRPWTLVLNGKVLGTDKNVAVLRALQQKQGGRIVRQGEMAEDSQLAEDDGLVSNNPQGIPEATGPTPTQVFPDTKQGAVASFTKNANKRFVQEMDLPNCKVWPDPSVEGVWAIDNYKTGVRVIVYLAGYKSPGGDIRGPYDDFEEGEIPEREMKRHRRNDQAMNDVEDERMSEGGAKDEFDNFLAGMDDEEMYKYANSDLPARNSSDKKLGVKLRRGATDEEPISREVGEGRFTHGPGGVPLDRQGNPIPPKVVEPKAPAAPRVHRDANGLTKDEYGTVWRKIEAVVGQIFPDGDPIDYLGPWLQKKGLKDFRIGEVLDKACRLNGYKDIYAYYDHFKTGDYGWEEPVDEGLDANQKAAGQAGPTDKAPLKGKLVGACESVAEGQEGLDTIRRLLGK